MEKLALGQKLESLRRSNEDQLYFITFLFALSTGEVGAVDMIKTGESSGYGRYSYSFREVFRLGVGWGYGLARACEMIGSKIKDNSDPLKQLLVKLSQVIRLGDELRVFFADEMAASIHLYSIRYERNLETQKLFLEMFYTISSTASFMIAANSIMAMLMGGTNSENVFLFSFMGVIVSMGAFIVIMYVIFPRDKLLSQKYNKTEKFKMTLIASLAIGISIGIALYFINVIPLTLVVVISVVPLFLPGFMARKLETELRGNDEWYPPFIRHMGEIYTMVGSMGQSLDAVLRSNFGPLQKQVIAFKNRIKNRINTETSFELFSMEAGTSVIESGNTIMSQALLKGANMNIVGNKVAEISAKINELRSKRIQTSKTFETIVIVLHSLTMAIFGLMSTLIEVFHTLLSTVPVSNQAFTLSPIDPNFIHMMMPLFIIVTSTINALAIKVGQGGLFKTVWFNIAMLTVLGGLTMFLTTTALGQFLTNHILDTYAPPGTVAAGNLPGISSNIIPGNSTG